MKASLFIGSSVEGLEIAYALQANLEHDVEVTVWDQGLFGLTKSGLASLLDRINAFDFAVLVMTPDDSATIRENEHSIVRDNVIFELGLFIGALGANRTYFLVPRDTPDLHLPSDLAGITPGTYDRRRSDGNIRAALGPFSHAIRMAIKSAGIRDGRIASVPATRQEASASVQTIASTCEAVVKALRSFIEEAELVRAKVLANEIGHEDAEVPLVRWKIKVCRYLDRNFGVEDATSFCGLCTSKGRGIASEHFRSAYQNHISFLEILAAEVEDDENYPLTSPARPSGRLTFAGVRFTYSRR